MAEKEIIVKVKTESDISSLEDLSNLIEDIQDKAEVEFSVSSDDSELQETEITAEDLQDDLDNLDNTTVSPDVDSSGVEELKEKTEEASSSMDSLTTAAVGIAGAAGLEEMISTADRINTSWNQLELTFGTVTEDMKNDISEAANVTGQSGGTIRNYFNQMGIAGVTNTDLLSSSFEALSGRAYQTGNSIESMETKMQTMVLTGNAGTKMLKGLGLSAEDLGQAMGVSAEEGGDAFKNLTPEERLQAISKAMGDGAEANEMYKNSYAGLKTQADTAMAGLMGAVGQAILPVVIPALQTATSFIKMLTDGFKALPGPVQAVIGGIGGFAAIALTAVGVLGTFGQVVGMVKGGLEVFNIVTKLSAAAEWLLNAAQAALNVVMSMNPIMLVVIALVALAAALVWAYYNVDWFRAMVDNAWASLVQLAQQIYGVVAGAIQWLGDQFNQFTSQLGLNTDNWIQAILGFILFIPQLPLQLGIALTNAIAKALGFGNNFVQNLVSAASRSVSGFMSYISSLPGKLQTELSNMLSAVGQWAATLPQKFWDAGVNAVQQFLSALGIASPGTMQRMLVWEVNEMGRRVPEEGKDLVSNIGALGDNVVDAFNPQLGLDNVDVAGVNGVLNNALLNLNSQSNGTGGDIIVNVYGDIDNDRRIQTLVEAVRRDLNFDNKTAGRTI